ncbi:glycosyltransferase involved in cell wall biosynthesis [Paenibacillus pabuli]|uniref:Glycosyltransferase involved in cell wall biosynthesis n=1 Tax=Paenibacillus pabuli TaxID=1472 RepID=A0ABX9BGZ6_9BACL|nr:glycosyltransferase involved in cell wall biosynthesis [Paenibacillus pabuli]
MRRLRILHIGEYVVGGMATYLNEVVGYQREFFDVYLLMSDYNSASDFDLEPDHILRYKYTRHPKYFFAAMRQIHQAIKSIQPDIIHIHSSFAGILARGLFFIFPQKASVFYCSHGWAFLMDTKPLYRKGYFLIEKLMEYKTDVIVNISKYELEQSLHLGLSASKSKLVYNGIREREASDFIPLSKSSEETDIIQLLFVGRYDRQKGLDIVLDMFKKHPELQQHIRLYVIGDTVLEDKVWEFPENIIRLGWVNNAEIDRYYQQCDAVIMPSRWEGFGLVAIEAMKNRKPVIGSSRGALPELIQHGESGYIFDIEHSHELLNILKNLDKAELVAMGEAGYAIYKDKFNASRMNEEIVGLYYEAFTGASVQEIPVTSRLEFSKRAGDAHD